MKKQLNPNLKAHLVRCAFYLLLLLSVCVIPFALAQRNLERVRHTAAQVRRLNGVPLASAGLIGSGIVGGDALGGACQYVITFGNDTIVPGNIDTGNHCAWCDTTINLPFP